MSLKGFQKTLIRAPQSLKYKLNLGEQTKDPLFADSERRFQELETETKKLQDAGKKYSAAIKGMMEHQIQFSQAIAEIYKPISGRLSDPGSLVQEGNPDGIKACEEYEAVVRDLMANLQPELEMIETRIIRPADELLDIIKVIRKTIVKRHHKQIDYDRHRATFKKLEDKVNKNLKDEQAIYKAENELDKATQEYNYLNDLLKRELPLLFELEREFIKPLFQSLYYMQLNIYYTLHEKMQGCDIGFFDLQVDLEAGFEMKRGDIRERAEALSITKFKTTGVKRPPKVLAKLDAPPERLAIEGSKPVLKPVPKPLTIKASPSSSTENESASPPPPYTIQNLTTGRMNSINSALGGVTKAKGAGPPPKPKPARLVASPTIETVVALYDFEAQAHDDLSFRVGDVIEVLARTGNENEWWTGKLRGKQGQFPGNYVRSAKWSG